MPGRDRYLDGLLGVGITIDFRGMSGHHRGIGGIRWLELDPLGDAECFVYFNPEITDGALKPCMAE